MTPTNCATRSWTLRHVARRRAGQARGKIFRIGHLGHFNDLMLGGTLAGVEMGLQLAEIPIDPSGVSVALELLRA